MNFSKSNKLQNSSFVRSTSSTKNYNPSNFGSNQNSKTPKKVSSPNLMISTNNNNNTSIGTTKGGNLSPTTNKKHNFISSPSSRNKN